MIQRNNPSNPYFNGIDRSKKTNGAHFGDNKRQHKVWIESPYGVYFPYIQN